MKRKLLIPCIAITISLLTSCRYTKTYKFTTNICNSNLYVEVYNINPAGVDADYLTDSANFRIYIGSFDEEHESFVYKCVGDSIYIVKIETGSKNCRWVTTTDSMQTVICDNDTVESKKFSLVYLKQQQKFE